MKIDIDGIGVSKSGRILKEVAADISRKYRAGDLFLTHREMMVQYQVSCTTVNRVMRELKRLGVLESKQGKGVFVVDPKSGAVERQLSFSIFSDKSSVANHAGVRLQEGLLRAQTSNNCKIIQHDFSGDADAAFAEFRSSGSDGVIFLGDKLEDLIDLVKMAAVPYVVARPTLTRRASSVEINVAAGMVAAVRNLVSRGAKKIVYIATYPHTPHNFEKTFAFQREMRKLEKEGVGYEIMEIDGPQVIGRISELMDILRSLPDGDGVILVSNVFFDLLTEVVSEVELNEGKCFRKVSFNTYQKVDGDVPVDAYIHLPFEEAAETAVLMLAKHLADGGFDPYCKVLDSEFRWLKSDL